MGFVSSWLLSITGVIMLSVLCELILPEGQINKYIRVIFSFITIFVIISPLPTVLGKEIDFSKWFSSSDVALQENYLYQININKLSALSDDIQTQVELSGIKNVKISINADVLQEKLEIYSVYVDLCDIEFSEEFVNKNITSAEESITKIIKSTNALSSVPITFIKPT